MRVGGQVWEVFTGARLFVAGDWAHDFERAASVGNDRLESGVWF